MSPVFPYLCTFILLLTLVGLLGCPTGDDDDSTVGDDDTAADDDDATPRAMLSFSGTAVVDPVSFAGEEELTVVADEGAGDELCRVTYSLHSTGGRADCTECDWAFDLEVSDAVIAAESDVDCATFGYGADEVAAMNGTTRAYGFAAEYIGHASTLMVHEGGVWQGQCFATFVEGTGDLSYSWDDAYLDY